MPQRSKYPTVELDGMPILTQEDTALEFVTDDDKKITVRVTAYAPLRPDFDLRALERWTDDNKQKTIYEIIPASEVWMGAHKVPEYNGVGWCAAEKKLILLLPAVDQWGPRKIESPVKYRSHGATHMLGKPRTIAAINVVGAAEAEAVQPV